MLEKFIKDALANVSISYFLFYYFRACPIKNNKDIQVVAFCFYSLHACTQPKVSNRVLLSRPHAQIFLGKIYHAAPGPIWSFNKFASFRRILILNIVSPSSKFL